MCQNPLCDERLVLFVSLLNLPLSIVAVISELALLCRQRSMFASLCTTAAAAAVAAATTTGLATSVYILFCCLFGRQRALTWHGYASHVACPLLLSSWRVSPERLDMVYFNSCREGKALYCYCRYGVPVYTHCPRTCSSPPPCVTCSCMVRCQCDCRLLFPALCASCYHYKLPCMLGYAGALL